MRESLRAVRVELSANSALLLGMAVLTLGAGLQATLLGVRATLEGFSTFVTGAVMAAYYVGFVIGSVAAPGLVRQVGHIRVFAALTATAAATILLQGVFVGAWEWGFLRTVSGMCFAGIYVVAESWLNDRADRRSRGVLLATYMVVIYVGLGVGQLLLNLADPNGLELFILIGVLISLAVVPIALTAQRAPDFSVPHRVSFRELLAISPLGAVGALFSGATAGTLFSLGPVYAASSSLDNSAVALFMASSILPAVVLQLPLGRLSDRVDRRNVLIAISISAAIAAAAAARLGVGSPMFFLAAAAYGGLSLTIYAVCLAHVNDHLQPSQMVAASATVLLANGIGSALGPVVVSAAMQLTGPEAFFVSIIVLHATFALYAAWRKRKTDAIPRPDKARFVSTPPQAAPTGRLAAPEAKRELGAETGGPS
jgi:MFS family permease